MTDTMNETEIVYRCEHHNHPGDVRHRHFITDRGRVTYSTDLDYQSTEPDTRRIEEVFLRDDSLPVYAPEVVPPTSTYVPTLALAKGTNLHHMGMASYAPVLVFDAGPSRLPEEYMVLTTARTGYAPSTMRTDHLPADQQAWIAETQQAMLAGGKPFWMTWVNRRSVRVLGPLPEAHRMFSEGHEYAHSKVPDLVEAQMKALEQAVADGLREQKEEREWCSELEDEWLPQMALPRKMVKTGPEYRTYEYNLTFSATATVETTQTVTIEVEDGETPEQTEERARERAIEEADDDLRGQIDFGHSRYALADVTYEIGDSSLDEEYESDEDGEPND